jgi:hypothetical protein
MRFNQSVCLFTFLLLFSSCSDDFLLNRTGADYFPLKKGCAWTYAVDGESVWVEVIGDSNAYGHFVTVVTRNFVEEYWLEERGKVKKFVAFLDTMLYQTGDTIEMGYKLIYQFPLVNQARWEDKELDTVVVAGDSFQHLYTLEGTSLYFGTVNSYFDCYKVEFYEMRELIALSDTNRRYRFSDSWVEFLAPGVGVVRRERGGKVENLVSFQQ